MENENIEKIRNFFYNPENDSLDILLPFLKGTHSAILKKTDFNKGTIPMGNKEYIKTLEKCELPKKIADSDSLMKLTANLFDGAVRWHSPRTMYNVTPSPLISTVAAYCLSSLYNPNLAWDIAAGNAAMAEQEIIAMMSKLIGWDWKKSGGVFVFGGKATNLYSIKLGLKNCQKNSSDKGANKDIYVISTKACHPCHISSCDWLGLGKDNCIRLNTDDSGVVNLNELEETLDNLFKNNKKVAAILISGGTTMDLVIDPIKEVADIRDRMVAKYSLDYSPHLHVDTVVGWPWIFFKEYDFAANPLRISPNSLQRLNDIVNNISNLDRADSIGLDFHKTGFCPYLSSLFMTKNKTELYGQVDNFVTYGNFKPFDFTLENSRGGQSAVTAYVALNTLGIEGFQTLMIHLINSTNELKEMLEQSGEFTVLNKNAFGLSAVFIPKIHGCEDVELIDKYTKHILNGLRKQGNPFFIDMIPAYSTGSIKAPHAALKTYTMSPFSNKKTNKEFVSTMLDIKNKVNFSDSVDSSFNDIHPLKRG